MKELLVLGVIKHLTWIDTFDMLSDGLNKGLVSRAALLLTAFTGQWTIKRPSLQYSEPAKVNQ